MTKSVTLGQYMAWVRDSGGYCTNGIQADHEIGMVPVIKLVADSGRYVIHPSDNQSEILEPSLIEYYDRRLGLVSPFKTTPRA
ncbi:hypothetical protein H2509_20630 [Stappia sp. F7233]|uniref:Uncharacterized protein n=1 Tax=Stappia albiluteola TaxID=2758565 RepID=A0A839AKK5_9HYPH|nr:hypothetical protein [Stappia albiluteola]MBA5779544.1 hypothetical protein [Stappia albiluteola]